MQLEAKNEQAVAAYEAIEELVDRFQKDVGNATEKLMLAMITQETAGLKQQLEALTIKNIQLEAKYTEAKAQYDWLLKYGAKYGITATDKIKEQTNEN